MKLFEKAYKVETPAEETQAAVDEMAEELTEAAPIPAEGAEETAADEFADFEEQEGTF